MYFSPTSLQAKPVQTIPIPQNTAPETNFTVLVYISAETSEPKVDQRPGGGGDGGRAGGGGGGGGRAGDRRERSA